MLRIRIGPRFLSWEMLQKGATGRVSDRSRRERAFLTPAWVGPNWVGWACQPRICTASRFSQPRPTSREVSPRSESRLVNFCPAASRPEFILRHCALKLLTRNKFVCLRAIYKFCVQTILLNNSRINEMVLIIENVRIYFRCLFARDVHIRVLGTRC